MSQKHFFPTENLKILCSSLVHPYYSNGIKAWFATNQNINKIIMIIEKNA